MTRQDIEPLLEIREDALKHNGLGKDEEALPDYVQRHEYESIPDPYGEARVPPR